MVYNVWNNSVHRDIILVEYELNPWSSNEKNMGITIFSAIFIPELGKDIEEVKLRIVNRAELAVLEWMLKGEYKS